MTLNRKVVVTLETVIMDNSIYYPLPIRARPEAGRGRVERRRRRDTRNVEMPVFSHRARARERKRESVRLAARMDSALIAMTRGRILIMSRLPLLSRLSISLPSSAKSRFRMSERARVVC